MKIISDTFNLKHYFINIQQQDIMITEKLKIEPIINVDSSIIHL